MPHIINHPLAHPTRPGQKIELKTDRLTLAKRRWHALAADGAEFGFDLANPLHDGDVILENESTHYVIAQTPEPVLEVALEETVAAARVAWSLGNLHFPIELDDRVIRVADDPAARLYFERVRISFSPNHRVFRPLQAITHSHGNTHPH